MKGTKKAGVGKKPKSCNTTTQPVGIPLAPQISWPPPARYPHTCARLRRKKLLKVGGSIPKMASLGSHLISPQTRSLPKGFRVANGFLINTPYYVKTPPGLPTLPGFRVMSYSHKTISRNHGAHACLFPICLLRHHRHVPRGQRPL